MPILTLQRQMRELGRIRTGNQVASGGGKRRPNKLETFRLTSSSKELIEAAAEAYGGEAIPWDNDGSPEFEVITTAPVMDIVVPPGQPVSQWNEMWSGGGCQRRCDGVTNVLTMTPCACPADLDVRRDLAAKGQACKATTRLNVILPELPDLGVWRLESHGYYAAVELAGAAEILAMASATGRLIPARLRLEQRSKKEPGKPTKQYAVPIIEFVDTRFGALGLTRLGPGDVPALGTGRVAATLPAGETRLPDDPPADDAEATAMSAPDDVVDGVIREDTEAPAPLSRVQLMEALAEIGVEPTAALERSFELWARPRSQALTDKQRGQLVDVLRRETAAAVAL